MARGGGVEQGFAERQSWRAPVAVRPARLALYPHPPRDGRALVRPPHRTHWEYLLDFSSREIFSGSTFLERIEPTSGPPLKKVNNECSSSFTWIEYIVFVFLAAFGTYKRIAIMSRCAPMCVGNKLAAPPAASRSAPRASAPSVIDTTLSSDRGLARPGPPPSHTPSHARPLVRRRRRERSRAPHRPHPRPHHGDARSLAHRHRLLRPGRAHLHAVHRGDGRGERHRVQR